MQGNFDADGAVASGASVINSQKLTDGTGAAATDATALTDVHVNGGTTAQFAVGDTLTLQGTKGGRTIQPPLTYTVSATSTVQNLRDFYNQGMQIKTDEPTLSGYEAPGAHIEADGTLSITGNSGTENAIQITGTAFTSTNPNMTMTFSDDPAKKAVGESVFTSMQVYDSLGTPVSVDVTATLTGKTDAGTTWTYIATSPDNTKAKTFDDTGTTDARLHRLGPRQRRVELRQQGRLCHQLADDAYARPRQHRRECPADREARFLQHVGDDDGESSMVMNKQDGYASGTISGFDVGTDGTISGTFTNGQSRKLGQVAIAMFDNPEGLTDQGGNLYTTGPNSGEATITSPQELSSGTIRSGSLEQSNVDISKEFINMIVASTGFTAASRVITTSDQLLTELMNTSR